MLLENKSVAIIGGGPGGLILAKLLQMKGVNVTLYERDFSKESRVQGGPLDMHEKSGLAALVQANLVEPFKANYLSGADRMVIVNENAEVLFSDPEDKPETDFGSEHFRPEIDRGTLRKILLESLIPGTVVWDSHFVSMEKQGMGWLLSFGNGSAIYADLVIGADGANSKIRPYISDIKPLYSGITMIEGNVYNSQKATPKVHALLKGGKIMAFGNEKNLLLGQKGDGDLGFYASFKAGKNWLTSSGLNYRDNTQMLAWFKTAYGEWSNIWHELFENALPPFIPRQINYMPLDQTWEALSNLTIIGDAAHVMPPFAGEGANMAMLDALELSECLTSGQFISIKEAIASYESNMHKRAADATLESLENGQKMHSATALTDMMEMFQQHR
jgi:2-polyprenyl-6-methoxyphenol hydroxylase-like FAD-dependent oxidoreductase